MIEGFHLADTIPLKKELDKVHILIGSDNYLDVKLPDRLEVQSGLYLLNSKFTGRTNQYDCDAAHTSMLILTHGNTIKNSCVFSSVDINVPMKLDLKDFWKLTTLGRTSDTLIGYLPIFQMLPKLPYHWYPFE